MNENIPIGGDDKVYSPIVAGGLSVDGACYTNPKVVTEYDGEVVSGQPVTEACANPACGPLGLYCYFSALTNTSILIPQPLHFPAPFVRSPVVDGSLAKYAATYFNNEQAGPTNNLSGVTYSPVESAIFAVRNQSSGGSIYVYSVPGNALTRTITLVNFVDVEGICWMFGNTFAVSEENGANRITIIEINSWDTTLNKNAFTSYETGLVTAGNNGIEGVTYDAPRDLIYYTTEKAFSGQWNVYALDRNSNTNTVLFDLLASPPGGITDIADMYYHTASDSIFILSQESKKIVRVTRAGVYMDERSVAEFTQPEGLTFTPDLTTLWVAGEPRDYGVYAVGYKQICYTHPVFYTEVTDPNAIPAHPAFEALPSDRYCGKPYLLVPCDGRGANVYTIYPEGVTAPATVKWGNKCYSNLGEMSEISAYAFVDRDQLLPVLGGCADVECTGADPNGSSVSYRLFETGQEVSVKFERLDLGIPFFGVAEKLIDDGFENLQAQTVAVRLKAETPVFVSTGTGKIEISVKIKGYAKTFFVNGVAQLKLGPGSTKGYLQVGKGDRVSLKTNRTMNGKIVTVAWKPVADLPRLYDTKVFTVDDTTSVTLKAVAFTGVSNRSNYRVYDTLPFKGSTTDVNPDCIVTVQGASGSELLLIRSKAPGDTDPVLPKPMVDYTNQTLTLPVTFRFYASRAYQGSHGEMDVWINEKNGTFPDTFKVDANRALVLPVGWYRRNTQVGDTSRNTLSVVDSPTGLIEPLPYVDGDGNRVYLRERATFVEQNGVTYTRVPVDYGYEPMPVPVVGVQVGTTWNVQALTDVGTTKSTSWKVSQTVGNSVGSTWKVDNNVYVGKTIQTSWKQRSTVGNQCSSLWRITNDVGASVSSQWAVRDAVGKDVNTLWDVAEPITFEVLDPTPTVPTLLAYVGSGSDTVALSEGVDNFKFGITIEFALSQIYPPTGVPQADNPGGTICEGPGFNVFIDWQFGPYGTIKFFFFQAHNGVYINRMGPYIELPAPDGLAHIYRVVFNLREAHVYIDDVYVRTEWYTNSATSLLDYENTGNILRYGTGIGTTTQNYPFEHGFWEDLKVWHGQYGTIPDRPWQIGSNSRTTTINIPRESWTSAALYDGLGHLKRTLWSAERTPAGNLNIKWDGQDDDGNYLDTGSYTVRILTHNVKHTWDGFIGNTSQPQQHTVWGAFEPIRRMVFDGSYGYVLYGYNENRYEMASFLISDPHKLINRFGKLVDINLGNQQGQDLAVVGGELLCKRVAGNVDAYHLTTGALLGSRDPSLFPATPMTTATFGNKTATVNFTNSTVEVADSVLGTTTVIGQVGGYANGVDVNYNRFGFYWYDNELKHDNDTWVAFQPDGKLWILDTATNRAIRYNSDFSYDTHVHYPTHAYTACVDKNNSARVFMRYLEYEVLDHTKALTDTTAWKLKRYWGHGHNHYGFADGFKSVATVSGTTYGLVLDKTPPEYSPPDAVTTQAVILNTTTGLQDTTMRYLSPLAFISADGKLRFTELVGNQLTFYYSNLDGTGKTSYKTMATTDSDPYYYNVDALSDGTLVSFRRDVGSGNDYHVGATAIAGSQWTWRTGKDGSFNGHGNFETDVDHLLSGFGCVGMDTYMGHVGEYWQNVHQGNQFYHYDQYGLLYDQFGVANYSRDTHPYPPGNPSNAISMQPFDGGTKHYVIMSDELGRGIHRWQVYNFASIQYVTGSISTIKPPATPTATGLAYNNGSFMLSWTPNAVSGVTTYLQRQDTILTSAGSTTIPYRDIDVVTGDTEYYDPYPFELADEGIYEGSPIVFVTSWWRIKHVGDGETYGGTTLSIYVSRTVNP
jgi:uncharacterized protein YjiK